jgi:hypothetical protein
VGAIDENGVFTATDRTGVSGEIRISYGDKSVSVPVQVGAKITFTDLFDPATGADHWAKSYIESLASQGIVNGIGDDMFGPEFALTRAQFLAMLAKTVDGLDLNAPPPSGFEDVPMEGWYYSYVNWGYAAGVVKGVDETHFSPDLPITREQMTVMLANFAAIRGIGLPDAGATPGFTDSAAISPWAGESVDKIVRAGVMNGMPEGGFAPQAGATRAQAAKVAYMIYTLAQQGTGAYPPPPEDGGAQTDTDEAPAPDADGAQTGADEAPAPDASGAAEGTQGADGAPAAGTSAPEGSGGAAETPGDTPIH